MEKFAPSSDAFKMLVWTRPADTSPHLDRLADEFEEARQRGIEKLNPRRQPQTSRHSQG